jgi:hypothetical protein
MTVASLRKGIPSRSDGMPLFIRDQAMEKHAKIYLLIS